MIYKESVVEKIMENTQYVENFQKIQNASKKNFFQGKKISLFLPNSNIYLPNLSVRIQNADTTHYEIKL